MRRLFRALLVFVVADLMVVGGLCWLAYTLFWSPAVGIMALSGSVALAGVGSRLLWDEFILPAYRIESPQNFIEIEED